MASLLYRCRLLRGLLQFKLVLLLLLLLVRSEPRRQLGRGRLHLATAHTSSCQCTLRDVTTLHPPLSPTPYVTHRHTSLDPLPFECDGIYGRPLM